MIPSLPAPRLFRQRCRHEDGWSDHYGALHTAFAYAGLPTPLRYTITGLWQHGCLGPWEAVTPGAIVFNAPGAQARPVFVARQEEADFLIAHGYPQARAIGVPILYTPPSGLARVPRSLLVMPTHTLTGDQFPDRTAFARYADEVREFAADFDHVTVCVHPSCERNGLWMTEFKERGFDIVTGAQTNDAQALARMRALFEQFDTVTTNGWGSHVAYALAMGAKVAIAGTRPAYSKEQHLRDLTWSADVRSLELTIGDDCQRQQREFLREFFVPPAQAVANRPLGEWLLGCRHQLAPAGMAEVLQQLVHAPVRPSTVPTMARSVLFAVPPRGTDGADAEMLRLVGWLREESSQEIAVLMPRHHPHRQAFATLTTVFSPEDLVAEPARLHEFSAIYAGSVACSELIDAAGASVLPVVTRVTAAGLNQSRLTPRHMAGSIQQSGRFLADTAAGTEQLVRIFRIPGEQVRTKAPVTSVESAAALWAEILEFCRDRPASAHVGTTLAGIYAGWSLPDLPLRSYVEAQLSRAVVRRQACGMIQTGRRREGAQILVGAVSRDLATKDPVIIVECLSEVAADLESLDARQAVILRTKAAEIARAAAIDLDPFLRSASRSTEVSRAA